jgi:acyl transferase domain-containing protein
LIPETRPPSFYRFSQKQPPHYLFIMATGLLFSGQGAQIVGMGLSLYENSPIAKALYDEANEILGWDLKKICFEGPDEALTETKVCQPALYVRGMWSEPWRADCIGSSGGV